MHNNQFVSMIPNYGKRARKAVTIRNKLSSTLSHDELKLIDEKQAKHGFRWSARTALTELGIKDPLTRNKAIQLSQRLNSYQQSLNEIEQNKTAPSAKRPTNQNYPNLYAELVENVSQLYNANAVKLVGLFGNVHNVNILLERIFFHQKNLRLAWEKQEEFLKLGRKSKS